MRLLPKGSGIIDKGSIFYEDKDLVKASDSQMKSLVSSVSKGRHRCPLGVV